SLRTDANLSHLHSFPTRRSSDLIRSQATSEDRAQLMALLCRITGSQRPIATTHIDTSEVIALDGNIFDTQASLLLSQQSAVERRSEEHTSELQSRFDLVCRLLLE